MNDPDSIYRHIGAVIKTRRKFLRLTQEKLSGRLGISRASLANIETGRQRVLVHQVYSFAAELDLRPAEFLPEPPGPPDRRTDGNWNELPLPNDLKPIQRMQIARLLEPERSSIARVRSNKDDSK